MKYKSFIRSAMCSRTIQMDPLDFVRGSEKKLFRMVCDHSMGVSMLLPPDFTLLVCNLSVLNTTETLNLNSAKVKTKFAQVDTKKVPTFAFQCFC